MVYLRRLMESRPYFRRIPDQKMMQGDAGRGSQHLQATRDREGKYAFVYFPGSDMDVKLDLSAMATTKLKAWWYDRGPEWERWWEWRSGRRFEAHRMVLIGCWCWMIRVRDLACPASWAEKEWR